MNLDQSTINRHVDIEILAAVAQQENTALCKQLIESSNRSFGQLIRQHEARMARIIGGMK